jgi:hypothetical protein
MGTCTPPPHSWCTCTGHTLASCRRSGFSIPGLFIAADIDIVFLKSQVQNKPSISNYYSNVLPNVVMNCLQNHLLTNLILANAIVMTTTWHTRWSPMETNCRNDNIICIYNLLHITTSTNKMHSVLRWCQKKNMNN